MRTGCWADLVLQNPISLGLSWVLEGRQAHLHSICIQLLKMSPNSLPLQNCIVSALKGTFPRTQPSPSPHRGAVSPRHLSGGANSPLLAQPPPGGDHSLSLLPPSSPGATGPHSPPHNTAGRGRGRKVLQRRRWGHWHEPESSVSPAPRTASRSVNTRTGPDVRHCLREPPTSSRPSSFCGTPGPSSAHPALRCSAWDCQPRRKLC